MASVARAMNLPTGRNADRVRLDAGPNFCLRLANIFITLRNFLIDSGMVACWMIEGMDANVIGMG